MRKFISLVALLSMLITFPGYSQQTGQPVGQNSIVFWGDFKTGDFIHYYSTKEVLEFYSVMKPIEKDSLYYFEEVVGDFIEMRFNSEINAGISYICFPNDTIEVLVIGPNAYRLKSKDPVRQHELDWQHDLDNAGLLGVREMDGNQVKIERAYRQNMQDLESKKSEGKISSRFYDIMKCKLVCAYISQLLYPILRDKEPHSEIDVAALFNMLPIDEKYLQIYTYNQALLNLTKASVSQGGLPLTRTNVLDAAKGNFEGRISDYIPAAFIRWEIMDNIFDYTDKELFVKSVNDPVYKNIILASYDKRIDQESKLISIGNQQLKLAEIIDVGKDTLLYVDFWASWCIPCKEEMKYYPELLDKFENKNVRFLFISMDTDLQSWKNEVKKHAFMDENNTFVLSDPKYAKLVKDLNIQAIPRYLVFKEGEIHVRNAARPSNIAEFEDFSPHKDF